VLGFQFRDFAEHRPDELVRNDDELWALLAAGVVSPRLGASFALDDVADALRLVADGRVVGKVVLDVAAPPDG
jgi:NADPH2:quinone reductase